MIAPDEYAVRLIDLPEAVGGFITESPDGFNNIYINARHGHNGQLRALDHELDHAAHDDLHSDEDVSTIEARAEGRDPRLKTLPKLIRARDLQPPANVPKHQATARPSFSAYNRSDLNDWYFNARDYD